MYGDYQPKKRVYKKYLNTWEDVLSLKVDELITKTFGYFKIRRNEYEQLGLYMENEIPLRFKSLCKTRWISHFECIGTIVKKWKVLQAFFNQPERRKNDLHAERI